ncbi:MAG: AAA family ATPase [Epulopiscium sp.]|nr:AAA family ATPase [Candidatus Epulonipiscium sp.]
MFFNLGHIFSGKEFSLWKIILLKGYKKFTEATIEFNTHMNILVGENEAGKTTILDAIKIVFNQQYRNMDKATLIELFNIQNIEKFYGDPCIENLPQIYIEVGLELDYKGKDAEYFYGENNRLKKPLFGIVFECKFDEELGMGLDNNIKDGKIPYEYYTTKWSTFAGLSYNKIRRPLNYLNIDTSINDSESSFNYYNRTLFSTSYDDSTKMMVKNMFREQIKDVFSNIELPSIGDKRHFGINDKKVVLESILSVYEDSIALENMGKGMESLIKTQIALDRSKSRLDVIVIEEPENHLCSSNLRKMIKGISDRKSDSQIIIATHSNLIASQLNLNNVQWITGSYSKSLKDVNKEVAEFFVKAENNNFLQLLLSKKAMLVEGATEFLLLPKIYYQLTKRAIEEDEITIISCNGISYKHYLDVVMDTNKKIAVITDNDMNEEKIKDMKDYNKGDMFSNIFMSDSIEDWTWEVAFYRINKNLLGSLIKVQENAKYLFHGIDYGQVLGKMLNNKVDTAYKMLNAESDFEIPQYIKDAIEWLNK